MGSSVGSAVVGSGVGSGVGCFPSTSMGVRGPGTQLGEPVASTGDGDGTGVLHTSVYSQLPSM
jgi:hypothetical protein